MECAAVDIAVAAAGGVVMNEVVRSDERRMELRLRSKLTAPHRKSRGEDSLLHQPRIHRSAILCSVTSGLLFFRSVSQSVFIQKKEDESRSSPKYVNAKTHGFSTPSD